MKSITFPLSPEERSTLYFHLGRLRAFCNGENLREGFDSLTPVKLVAVACEESRFEPRLFGILLDYVAHHFATLNPFELAATIREIPTPQTLGVITEFSMKVNEDPNLSAFVSIALKEIFPAAMQTYFISQVRPRPKRMELEILYTPDEFKKWGFWASFDPYLKEKKPRKSARTFRQHDRRKILLHLFSKKQNLKMQDYLQALGGAVTRQQAHKDLIGLPGVKAIGKNRGRIYRKKSVQLPGKRERSGL